MNHPKITIIILNWNGWKDTIECLESIYRINYPNYDVIVVDNFSQNNSVQKIKEYCKGNIPIQSKFFKFNLESKPIEILEYDKEMAEKGGDVEKEKCFSMINRKYRLRLITSDDNYGFSEGNNIGIRYALKALNPDYVLLLNNDTVVDKGLLELAKFAESDERIGILGPRINYYEHSNKTFSVGGKINWWTGKNSAVNVVKENQKIDYISGCALFIKKDVLNKIGLLPKEYFMYAEELDYCEHAKQHGFLIYNYPKTTVWHKISASSENKFVMYYRTRNRFIFMKKYSSYYNYIAFTLWRLTIDFFIETLVLIYRRDYNAYKAYLKGLYDGFFFKIVKRNI